MTKKANEVSDLQCVQIALDAACTALETAINTVECASIDVSTGEELPWYKQAHNALVLAGRPWDSIRRLPMTEKRFQSEVHDYRTDDLREAVEKSLAYQGQGIDCVVVNTMIAGADRYCLMLKIAAEGSGLPIQSAGLDRCTFKIGLTTCGYAKHEHYRANGESMNHEFTPSA